MNLGELGIQRLNEYITTINDLVNSDKIIPDLVIASGNSGTAMAAITMLILKKFNIDNLAVISIPFHREPLELQNPQLYIDDVVSQLLPITKQIRTVFFVDDEIGKGDTALSAYQILKLGLIKTKRATDFEYYIIAEDQGFHVPVYESQVKFKAYAQETEGYNNVIFFSTPAELEKPIIDTIGGDDALPFHHRVNLLLGLPLKSIKNGLPQFEYETLTRAKLTIAKFSELQDHYNNYLQKIIDNFIENN